MKEKYDGYRINYSVEITEKGIGKKAHIIVEKTKDFFEKQMDIYNEHKSELNMVETLFKL